MRFDTVKLLKIYYTSNKSNSKTRSASRFWDGESSQLFLRESWVSFDNKYLVTYGAWKFTEPPTALRFPYLQKAWKIARERFLQDGYGQSLKCCIKKCFTDFQDADLFVEDKMGCKVRYTAQTSKRSDTTLYSKVNRLQETICSGLTTFWPANHIWRKRQTIVYCWIKPIYASITAHNYHYCEKFLLRGAWNFSLYPVGTAYALPSLRCFLCDNRGFCDKTHPDRMDCGAAVYRRGSGAGAGQHRCWKSQRRCHTGILAPDWTRQRLCRRCGTLGFRSIGGCGAGTLLLQWASTTGCGVGCSASPMYSGAAADRTRCDLVRA